MRAFAVGLGVQRQVREQHVRDDVERVVWRHRRDEAFLKLGDAFRYGVKVSAKLSPVLIEVDRRWPSNTVDPYLAHSAASVSRPFRVAPPFPPVHAFGLAEP